MSKDIKSSPLPIFDTLEHIVSSQVFDRLQELPANYRKDCHYAHEFLFSYRGSEATFSAYRRELERFLQWSWYVAKKSLKDIRRLDFESFVEFCQNPPMDWITTKHHPRFINQEGARKPNPEWRPFFVKSFDRKQYQLSQKALQAIFAVLGSFFNYLVQEEYIDMNPVAQIRQKSKFLRKTQTHAIIRRLSDLQWLYVIETAEQMANGNPEQHERTLFIMNALYGMYLRISELAASKRWEPQMGHFSLDHDKNWWFTTVGKGNKSRMITVSDAMLAALKRYRKHLNLLPLPSPGESLPLLPKFRGKGPITSTRQIRSIVQMCFDQAISRLKTDGFNDEAQQLQSATVHWLRHTGISDDVKHRPREHVRDDAGHGSSAITDRYIDVELRERHASGKKKLIKK